ncbi:MULTISPECIES: 16S rRNA (guanine(527)-N(7))-methyltransferase RsmG [Veillonella]|uniref:16S rRNA (guanine(527)-N(7))-methyltransferase RsmG n=1 Tax=Veillonella TaxID=29465 RepID=UPI0025F7BD12|nr:16S rRNA (guanine(527)-N(7))-methyltransferase RsmG [Veillonella ratti]
MNFTDNLAIQLKAAGFSATTDQLSQFTTYYEMLIETNKYLNLTAITDPHEVAVKHFVDSLTALDDKDLIFKEGAKLLDLGIVLFDSLQKRLNFLSDVISKLGLHKVITLHGRAEDISHDSAHREAYDLVTSRAVARLPVLLEWALPYVKQNGYMVALKGAAYEEEMAEASKALKILKGSIEQVKPVQLPTLDDKRAIIYIKKTGVTPKLYPRKPKDIKTKPLV